jgi:hypothetical protein
VAAGTTTSGDTVVRMSRSKRVPPGAGAGTAGQMPGRTDAGQTLVEFALVFPLFMVLLLAAIEFGFAFNASLSLGYATRDASLVAAVSGNAPGGDCLVLDKVEQDVSAPADRSRITTVEIYWSDANGGSMSCEARDGSTYTLPYKLTTAAYPEIDRCMILSGCGNGHATVDTVGVKVAYIHPWRTPLGGLLNWGNSKSWQFERANAMRMEPLL